MWHELLTLVIDNLEWIGLFFGVIGGIVLTQPSYRAKVIGFELWVYSNVFWLLFAYTIHSWAVAINYIFFMAVSIVGIWTHYPLAEAEAKVKQELLKIPQKDINPPT